MRQVNFLIVLITVVLSVSCRDERKTQGQREISKNYISPFGDFPFFSFLNLDFPGMEEVKACIVPGDLEKANEAYLNFRRNRSKTLWFIDPKVKPKNSLTYDAEAAERIMQHYVRFGNIVYNNKEIFLGEDINWDYNPLNPSDPDFDTQFSHFLHRLPMWNVLGKAYIATQNEKYAEEWISQMRDWIRENPVSLNSGPGDGPFAWWTLNPGIRMSGSWMNAYNSFLFSPSFTPEDNINFIKSVIEHGQRLEKITLENPKRTGNWIIMECEGLSTIGILFPELKDAQGFLKVALDRLNIELDRQVYPDGAQIELAPAYHQGVRSNYIQVVKLAQMNDITLPKGFLDKLRKMYEFNLCLMDPSGVLPPFNDAPPSLILSSLKEAYEIWNDERFLFGATLGKEGLKPEFDSYFFNYAGYYVMRSGWTINDNCLYFDAGPVGYAHQHEDMLNLYLYSHGKILLTEPGKYSYDKSEWRRYSLSTPGHNTIIVDKKEQHRTDIPESRLIKEPLNNTWVTSPVFDYGTGMYSSGYQETKYNPVQYLPREYVGEKDTTISHARHVIFLKPYYYVAIDFLEGTGEHLFDAHFHLDAPDAKIEEESLAVHSLRSDSVQLGLYPLDTINLQVKVVKGQENPILGWIPWEKRAIPTVVYTKNQVAPAVFSTLIYPYYIERPGISYTEIMEGNNSIWGKRISTPYETASIIINRNPDIENVEIASGIGTPFKTDAKVTVIRRPKINSNEYLGFYGISEYSDKSLELRTNTSVSLLEIRNGDKILIFNPLEEPVTVTFSRPIKKKYTLPSKKWVNISDEGITEWREKVPFN